MDNFILTATCHATTGVVAAVSVFLAERDCYIRGLERFDDEPTNIFFMPTVFRREEQSSKAVFHGI